MAAACGLGLAATALHPFGGVARLLGYQGEQLPEGLGLMRRLHPHDRERVRRAVKEAIATGAPLMKLPACSALMAAIAGFRHVASAT